MALRRFSDQERKRRKAEEQRRRRASEKGRAWSKEYYSRPEVKAKKRELSRRPSQVDSRRNCAYKKDFGITLETYKQLVIAQAGLCLICGKTEKRRLAVDHDHVSGKVRGLLCGNCNRGLGLFKDNPRLLANAIAYITDELR